ncbi:hypothetical protein D9613_011925 [Agrocybe pediades]|uniref:Uncharacterized protein n=1 Tax=Agrocybe pediades TaxID=84607 RepID=A0A8H4VJ04_9AGAR|nr:hypothetical protein D9613_011925 [Agrocybe pediades]
MSGGLNLIAKSILRHAIRSKSCLISEEVDLPRKEVEDYLEGTSPELRAKYLDYIIEERQSEETATSFHHRMAVLYLSMKLAAKKPKDECV